MEDYDFIIIGAGLSGIDAAYRLKTELPGCSYTVLEARDTIGGTWSFFHFPGIRSDSTLTLFGLPWRPWIHEKVMADAALIQEYIGTAARDEGIDRQIRFSHRVTGANWDSGEQRWFLDVDAGGAEKKKKKKQKKQYRARWVIACSGYYDYAKPLEADIPGIQNFKGLVVHPQFWPTDLDWSGKKIVIVGSGATAVTLLPNLAKTAGHVTMLQRSPSYVFSIPSVQPGNIWLMKYLPAWLAHPIIWWRSFFIETLFVQFNLTFPNLGRKLLMYLMKKQLPDDIPVDVHFNPRYSPFEQRLCMCPDGDFFQALRQDNCDIVTSSIRNVESDGILTESGEKLEADIIVTATGLHVHLLGGVVPTVDGKPVDVPSCYTWRGMMLSGVPNIGAIIGYTTSSWTLGADSSIKMLIRVYKHMTKVGATSAVPVYDGDGPQSAKPVVSHSSTYFVKAEKRLPRITGNSPWYGRVNAVYDTWMLWFGSVTKGMRYVTPEKKDQ